MSACKPAIPEKLDIPHVVAGLPLFEQLPPAQQAGIAAECRERRLDKGGMLFHKGDPARGFFVVIRGQIKLAFPAPQGNEKVVGIVGPRQSFGEALMFMDQPYPVFAEAVVDSVLLHIPQGPVNQLMGCDQDFARAMLAGLSRRLHMLVQDVESYSIRSCAQRVIAYLLQHCPGVREGTAEVVLPTSKYVIASLLNLTPETLSRVLHDLCESELIDMHGKHILIPDLGRLRQFDL